MKKETALRRVHLTVSLPLWLVEWLRAEGNASRIIEKAVCEKHDLELPKSEMKCLSNKINAKMKKINSEKCSNCKKYGKPQCEAEKMGETPGPADWCAGYRPKQKRRES